MGVILLLRVFEGGEVSIEDCGGSFVHVDGAFELPCKLFDSSILDGQIADILVDPEWRAIPDIAQVIGGELRVISCLAVLGSDGRLKSIVLHLIIINTEHLRKMNVRKIDT